MLNKYSKQFMWHEGTDSINCPPVADKISHEICLHHESSYFKNDANRSKTDDKVFETNYCHCVAGEISQGKFILCGSLLHILEINQIQDDSDMEMQIGKTRIDPVQLVKYFINIPVSMG